MASGAGCGSAPTQHLRKDMAVCDGVTLRCAKRRRGNIEKVQTDKRDEVRKGKRGV